MRTVKAVTALAGRLAGWPAGLAGCATEYSNESCCTATRVHRTCTPGRAISLPRNRYFYTNSDNRLHNFTVPSNTVEITDGFSNARAVGFTLLQKTRRSSVRLSSS